MAVPCTRVNREGSQDAGADLPVEVGLHGDVVFELQFGAQPAGPCQVGKAGAWAKQHSLLCPIIPEPL